MPNALEEKQKLIRAVRNWVETAQEFGEDGFVRANPVAAAISIPVSAGSESSRVPATALNTAVEQLHQQYANCQRCRLAVGRNRIVFGMGSLQPKVLFVGEGPGFEEDRTGLPFVGKAGQLLDKILKAIDLDRNNVYIANIVKCHPMKDPSQPEMRGNDRPPEPDEMAACREILNRQMEILNPPVICALGATAAKALLGREEGIMRLRGRVFEFQLPNGKTVPLVPTYHPAALLRNEALKKDAWQDMKLLRTLIQPSAPTAHS